MEQNQDQPSVMDYVFFRLMPNDYVAYFGDGVANRVFLAYQPFVGFLRKMFPRIINYDELKKELDSFQLVLLQQSGQWEVVQEEYMDNPSQAKFQDLYAINKKDEQSKPINEEARQKSYSLYDLMKRKKENAYGTRSLRTGRQRL